MTTGPALELDGEVLSTKLGQSPFLIRHRLHDHPLFKLERLVDLAKTLPEKSVEYNAGELKPNQDPKLTPRTGLSIEESLKRIRERSSWMVLKNVEQDASYRAVLDSCLDEIQAHSDRIEPGMTQREAFIFVSSPNAVTPFHMDPEQNFLLQIAGHKHVHQWKREDRVVIGETDIERFFTFAPHRNLAYKEMFEERAQVFQLQPGMGLHFPSMAPHWVKNGTDVSISFSITFRTKSTVRAAAVYRLNQALRRRGLSPRPPGSSPLMDRAKFNVVRVLDKWNRLRNTKK